HLVPVDCGMRRQRSGALQDVCERSIIVPDERNPLCKRRKLFAQDLQPQSFKSRIANHHSYGFGVRQDAKDILDDGREVLRDRDDSVILWETRTLNEALLHCCEYHRSRGKELLPAPLHEVGRGAADAHNQIERAFGKQSTEVLDKWNLRIFVAGTRSHKLFLNDLQRPWRLP